ncbi:hypothetical protein M406DRAFT_289374 [Cryphonectria parasitica EP155]|uniref:Glycosyltransferase 2 n=1 Tax=Cryphonectria parasitica (strain ATCC 38755 / EP155) TaxID=660469 RepID=A0A9P5CR01_CRYP1|nr:uncharacterized protein M406DRAFT_289374 [Cryphonectria parasitica EP155]KAF3768049.1 hypothetical protein M406DRAFT_289374 [Cryphonectria parasitica EP155]
MRPRLDPELGVAKKDDDHFVKDGKSPTGWRVKNAPRIPPRKTFRRLGLLILLAVAVYVFIAHMPTDLGPQDKRRPVYTYSNGIVPPGGVPQQPRPPVSNGVLEIDTAAASATRNYNGAVRFLELAETLHAISATKGDSVSNLNVLFMASTLKSANDLLPIACQMGRELRSYVHFALMSRDEIPVQQLKDVNGIGEDCHIIFHDARPEFAALSTDERFEKCVSRALYHINNYMHPQAILVDSSDAEEPLFLKSMRQTVSKMGIQAAVIELPTNPEERLGWITKLDASSLLPWNLLTVEILIHAHTDASGSLIRLLKSLSAADYTGCTIPHLTIELPEHVDPPTSGFLQNFQWPPRDPRQPASANQLTLRHRVSRRGMTEEESSARFLEGFWPANPRLSHVLVLSPQAELSPNFFHYLKMAILEYRYSKHAISGAWDQRLFGISLDLPSTDLSGSGPFTPPLNMPVGSEVPGLPEGPTSFLWQAPNSNAMLFTGEKWAELHGFVSQLLEVQHSSTTPPAILSEKVVSKGHPAWMEHALRLCRGRGYWTLYPSAELAANLATVHNELYRPPEEYESDGPAPQQQQQQHDDEDEVVIHRTTLVDSLPNNGLLPSFQEMPLLAWDGSRAGLGDFDEASILYATQFRRTAGGCDEEAASRPSTSLFCARDDGI